MIIGIEFNRMKTTDGHTYYRMAPYLHNISKTKAGVAALIIVTIAFFSIWGSIANAEPTDNSHIKPWTTYNVPYGNP